MYTYTYVYVRARFSSRSSSIFVFVCFLKKVPTYTKMGQHDRSDDAITHPKQGAFQCPVKQKHFFLCGPHVVSVTISNYDANRLLVTINSPAHMSGSPDFGAQHVVVS